LKITRHGLAITWHAAIRDKATVEDAPQKLAQVLQQFFTTHAERSSTRD